jgi:drug/metabolite transporter (DMT)-like permease
MYVKQFLPRNPILDTIRRSNTCCTLNHFLELNFLMPATDRSSFLAYLALAVGIVSVSFSAILVRWANAPGTVASFYRMAVAAVLMAWPFYRRVSARRSLPRLGVRVAMLGGVFFAADLAFWASGVVLSGATNPTLLANTAPLWVGLGSLIFFGDRFGVKFWIGLILAMSGAMLILGQDSLRAATFGLGTLFGLIAAIFYGSYFLITQHGRESLDSLTYFWLTALSASLGLLAISLVLRQPLTGYSVLTYLNFLILGVVVQVLGWLTINYAQGYLPAAIVAPTMLAQPVMTALLAGPLLGENLSLWQILGGVAVLTGVYAVHRSQQENPGK